MRNYIKKIKKKLTDDRGATIMVAYVLFLPIFLLALVMLFELTKMQALKNINECVTDIAANAAARQIDYQNQDVNIRLNDFNGNPGRYTDSSIWGVSPGSTSISQYTSSLNTINAILKEANGTVGASRPIMQYDDLSAESVALALYTANADANGLNNPEVNKTKISSVSIQVFNNVPHSFTDPIINKKITVNLPAVFLVSRVKYTTNPILQFATGNQIKDIFIGSSSISQLVSSPSSDVDRTEGP